MRRVDQQSRPAKDPDLRAIVDALAARVDALERARDADDRAYVRSLADAFGATPFRNVDVRRHRRVDPRLRALSPREVGARLRALRGRSIDGFVLGVVKRSHGVRLWAVSVIDDRHEVTSAAPPVGAQ